MRIIAMMKTSVQNLKGNTLLLVLTALVFVLSSGNLSAQWSISQGGFDLSFTSGFFITENTAYISGNNGTLLKSTDGGDRWFILPSPRVDDLAIYFINAERGFAAGTAGKLFKTTDGGNTWTEKYTNTSEPLTSIYFIDENTGFIAGGGYQKSILIKTTDGGESWSPAALPDNTISISSIKFFSPLVGYISGNINIIYKTTDGGTTWKPIGSTGTTNWLRKLYFLSGTTGFVLGEDQFNLDSQILRTTDGGSNWNIVYTYKAYNKINSICFYNNSSGYAAGDSGLLLKTTDSGKTWNKLNSGISSNIAVVLCGSENVFNLATFDYIGTSSVYRTTDGGITFKSLINAPANPKHLVSISFPDENNGFAGGYEGTIFKTTDAGLNWVLKKPDPPYYIDELYFINTSVGLAGANGDSTLIIKTTDGGETWKMVHTQKGLWVTSLYFPDNNTGYCTTYDGIILKTTDQGDTWFQSAKGNFLWLESSFFKDKDTGFVGGFSSSPIILRTMNGGADWDTIYKCPDNSGLGFSSIQFINETGYAVNHSGPMIKTADGGMTWSEITPSWPYMFRKASFIDADNGYAVGYPGKIYRTRDGGITWFMEASGVTNLLNIYFSKNGSAFAVGYWGTILKYNPSSPSGMNEESESILPGRYTLSQNYPNPFNPSTTINYSVSAAGLVTLIVYDILGRESAVLVNECKEPGTYKVQFNASALTSGVYIYRLKAGPYEQSRKLIYLK